MTGDRDLVRWTDHLRIKVQTVLRFGTTQFRHPRLTASPFCLAVSYSGQTIVIYFEAD